MLVGGLPAIEHLILNFNPSLLTTCPRILDIGCGLGGTTRTIKEMIKNSIVHGIDLTPEYIDVSRELSTMIGMNDITYDIGSATKLPLEDNSFDIVMLIHVGMNIKDKEKMFKEAFRVLKTGGCFAIFDVMYEKDNDDSKLLFPLPWATDISQSFVTSPNDYKQSGINSGFSLKFENNRGDFGRDFFNKMTTKAKTLSGPAPLSLPKITFGSNGLNKMKNIVYLLNNNVLAPVELIFEKK
jgi:SAM-dependent methyltransferase